jgi:hypothetical protein
MSGRQTSIIFDDYRAEVMPLDLVGLAQGSPLLPILFAFFNCALVDQLVGFHGGAFSFIDIYFRWRVSWSAEENLAKIHPENIPRIETWARRTGSCFAAEKTELIDITRKRKGQSQGQLVMNGNAIKPSMTAKVQSPGHNVRP